MKNIFTLKKIVPVVLIAALFSGFCSCESYLDVDEYIYDQTTLDSIFTRKAKVLEYINGTAELLPNEQNLFTSSPFPFALASDECFASWEDSRHAGMYFLLGNVTAMSGYFNNWGTFYQGIRKASIILNRISECDELSDLERRDYIGRAYFLRGYFYFCLLRQYGPVPIVPDIPFDADESSENASVERSTYEECVNYICENMQKASEFLPANREYAIRNVPNSGAAMAVISRMRLYAASPWYNGNTRYASWKTSSGDHFIPQTEDKTKWGVAAAAAKRVIETGWYELNIEERGDYTLPLPANVPDLPYPDGAGGLDAYLSYSGIFNGNTPEESNPELIYWYAGKPRGDSPGWIAFPYLMGGGNGFNVTQDMIDGYRMIDGRDITDSSDEYPYPLEEEMGDPIGTGYSFSGIYPVSANMPKMYHNREARFYASIGYNHCMWPGTSYYGSRTESITNVELTYYVDGSGGPPAGLQNDYNRTGYTAKKYIHPADNMEAKDNLRVKVMPIFRYAEILLNYVEAMNEMEGSYTDEVNGITVTRDPEEMKKYFNRIRYRAALPGITDADVNDRNRMRELIKHERKIEFAFEGYRYHDLRRWGEAEEAYNKKIVGMNVNARTSERSKYFVRTILDSETITKRTFSQKMYFYPIPQTVLNKNSKLVQNPGW